jgi:signal recognition particle receptor subunit beta
MVLFNYTTRELTAKIVYYGPGLCGKTTNLQYVYDGLPGHVKKGKMLSLATKTDRTLFFDFLPIELGRIRGMRTRVQLYTVPGQVFYNSTRKLVLKGADGVVFVADSQQKMMESNIESYRNLEENLQEIGLKLEEIPLVMQFNKRDLPNLASVEEMNTLINRHNAPFYEAVATTGIGVEDTLKAVTKLVLNHLASKYQLGTPGEGKSEERAEPLRPIAAEAGLPGKTGAPLGGSETGRSSRPEESDDSDPLAMDSSMEEEALLPSGRDRGISASPAEDLEILDLAEQVTAEMGPGEEPSRLSRVHGSPAEDLSGLLEEIPEDSPEEVLEILDDGAGSLEGLSEQEPASGFLRAAASGVSVARPVPESPRSFTRTPVTDREIRPSDPLGILSSGTVEAAVPAIQVGAVTPGRQHQITVPLEMSVEGRKVRLHLKMTLTLSS